MHRSVAARACLGCAAASLPSCAAVAEVARFCLVLWVQVWALIAPRSCSRTC